MLSPEQILIIGLVASLLGAVLRFAANRFGFMPGKAAMTVVVAVVSLGLAVVFNLPALPIYVDPLQYLGEWLVILSGYVGMATAIYNLILDKIFDKLNLTQARFFKPR